METRKIVRIMDASFRTQVIMSHGARNPFHRTLASVGFNRSPSAPVRAGMATPRGSRIYEHRSSRFGRGVSEPPWCLF